VFQTYFDFVFAVLPLPICISAKKKVYFLLPYLPLLPFLWHCGYPPTNKRGGYRRIKYRPDIGFSPYLTEKIEKITKSLKK